MDFSLGLSISPSLLGRARNHLKLQYAHTSVASVALQPLPTQQTHQLFVQALRIARSLEIVLPHLLKRY